MVSWIEELERRERVVLERLEVLRAQIAALTEQVAEQEEQLSRLAITRETMTQILTGADQPEVRVSGAVVGSPIGVVTVPPWRPGLDAGVLPVAYRDILEVLADAGRPLRGAGNRCVMSRKRRGSPGSVSCGGVRRGRSRR